MKNKSGQVSPAGVSEPKLGSAASAPAPVRLAAVIAIVQSLAVIGFGCFLIYRDITHASNDSMVYEGSAPARVGTGTAVFLFICFGFVIAGTFAMLKGKRWGRGAIVLMEFILAACSFQMMSAGAVALGVATLASALVALFLLMFVPASTQWAAAHYGG
ncbi:hypothetical protein G7Y31_03110 [Corynebacterium lizhenjunii]|uniref:Uncharacterized protein n=1 Tax=Corynebacterium lizhenjunii TaxID=2709394 RepID=A0A7T0PAB7_9CORY|nr:hypothetical protein [Corynebacterium lizhenjunii]QPK79708.1 hypothetical protein G7Y31_03110 [Corynebacterium lizhenjunii]